MRSQAIRKRRNGLAPSVCSGGVDLTSWELHYLIRALNVAQDSPSFPAAENWDHNGRV